MYRPLNFSMADRIAAAKTSTNNKTDIAAVPGKVNANPGSTQMSPNTQSLDQAGQSVNGEQGKANQATSQEAQNAKTAETNKLTYNRPGEPTYPNEKDPAKTTPKPQNKTFTERLLDNQLQAKLNGPDRPVNNTQNTEYPKDQAADINKPQPTDNTPTRPNMKGFDPAAIQGSSQEQPSGDLLTGVPGMIPVAKLGPKYSTIGQFKPIGIKASSIPKPKFR
jgi:hypothetical protein